MGGANVLARTPPEEKGSAPLPRNGGTADLFVAGTGLEPATSRLWASRATNCSTPRRKKIGTGLTRTFCRINQIRSIMAMDEP